MIFSLPIQRTYPDGAGTSIVVLLMDGFYLRGLKKSL
jgi:hypothetical protein